MSKEQDFIDSIEGELTPEQVSQLMQLGDEGDTGGKPDEGSAPDAPTDQDGDTEDEKAGKESQHDDDEGAQEEGDTEEEVEHTPENTVILAKDRKHTISYDKLVEAREAEKRWKAEAEARKAEAEARARELEELKAAAQSRADAGVAPTDMDNKVRVAEAAIDAGADPELFGDFSEEALTKGILTLVDRQVEQRMEELKRDLEPLTQRHQVAEQHDHYQAIYNAHPDADSIVESQELADWIASQPSFARGGYEKILTEGSAQQVIELFDAFKSTTKPAEASAPAADEIKARAKQAAAKAAQDVPASLSDIPGGAAAATNPAEAMANMDAVQLLGAMDKMSPEEIERLLNHL